jgi:hypothetical protein
MLGLLTVSFLYLCLSRTRERFFRKPQVISRQSPVLSANRFLQLSRDIREQHDSSEFKSKTLAERLTVLKFPLEPEVSNE